MLFSQVIGQSKIKSRLISSVKAERIPHAQLFHGPEGCGSLVLAIAYAQYICCENKSDSDSCGICHSCRKFEKLVHPDLHFAYPVNTSKDISKDPVSDDYIALWREQILSNPYFRSSQWYNFIGIENKQGLISKNESESIIRKLNLKSFESEYKILIIWLPEKMNATASNMLLKLIEEPPEKTIFLLVSEEPQQVLLTIASRTQPIKLDRLSNSEIKEALQSGYEVHADVAASIARLSNGSFIAALENLEKSEEQSFNFSQFTTIMRLSYMRNIPEINNWVDEMSGIGRERLKSFFNYALRIIRENFILNLNNPEIVYLSIEEEQFSEKFHPYINGRNIMAISEEINAASNDIERNANAKIVLFDMALKIVKLIRK
ncbi:MAG: DNA polymerase III subunit delta [Bacteroidales bacterium]|nr:DNA polymerase III subunit delta [Bacteroidales bacterium]